VLMRNSGRVSSVNLFSSALTIIICLAFALSAMGQAPSQGTPSLQPYNAPDQSAQAGVPPGWKVTKGAATVIIMSGPNGETINLGGTYIVKNAAFQLGQQPSGGIDLSMPNSASLDQKFTMLEQWGASLANAADPQVKIASNTPMQVPLAGIQCGRMSGTFNGKTGPLAFGLLMCSLPVDVGGTYKVMMKLAQAPPTVAAQEAALAGAVFASYRIAPGMLQKKLGPNFIPAPMPAPSVSPGGGTGGGGGGGGGMMPSPDDPVQNGCYDLVVIRQTPKYQLPRKCGGTAPDE
jgi:hypothetical protein